MGLLTTFFVATKPEAIAYTGSTQLPPEDVLESGGLHIFHLAVLRGIVLEVPALHGMNELFPLVSDPESEASWTFGIAEDVRDALIAAGEPELEAIAEEWIEAEDMAGCTLEVGLCLLTDLRRLSVRAKETGRGLYLWVSL